MITSIVAAIAISQREARRKKAEQEAELEAASKKSVLIVSGGIPGLATAFVLHQFGFTVTIVDEREELGVDEDEGELVVVPAMTVQLLVKAGRLEPSEDIKKALDDAGSPEVRATHFFLLPINLPPIRPLRWLQNRAPVGNHFRGSGLVLTRRLGLIRVGQDPAVGDSCTSGR